MGEYYCLAPEYTHRHDTHEGLMAYLSYLPGDQIGLGEEWRQGQNLYRWLLPVAGKKVFIRREG